MAQWQMLIQVACPCEGELYGFTEHLPWRAPHRETSTLGLLSAHVERKYRGTGAVGGVAGSDDHLVNLYGAMAESVPGDMKHARELK